MENVFLFPGQGSQNPKMGKDFYDNFKEAKEIFDLANDVTKINIKELCFDASKEELKKTKNAQLSIATTSLAILEVLKSKKIEAKYTAGLSLGEYVSLVYGGFLKIEDCFYLLKMRGYYMQNLTPEDSYAMIAVIGIPSNIIEDVCNKYRNKGNFIAISNYNYSLQTVVTIHKDSILEVSSLLKEAGAKRVIEINTSGPFHTEKLKQAKDEYIKDLKKVKFLSGNNVKVIKNIDGEFYTKGDDFVDILSKHIVSPVRFDKAIDKLKKSKIDNFIEVGPGNTLTGFIKKEIKEAKCYCINSIENLDKYLGGE